MSEHGSIKCPIQDGRLHLSSVCDGTWIFMDELITILNALGCTDIQTETEHIQDACPPWKSCRFKASGKVPDRLPQNGTVLLVPEGSGYAVYLLKEDTP